MKIGEKAGVVDGMARVLSPVFSRLFPDVPKNHPVYGNIFMNLSANMLGLDNAATPLGLKAMEGLQALNPRKDTASNPMIMFLVLNTSGLTIIPVSVIVYRAQLGAAQPTDVFVPLLIATFFSTLAGIVVTSLYQRINLLQPILLATLGGMSLAVVTLIWGFSQLDSMMMNLVRTTTANVLLFTIIISFVVAGLRKRLNVYDAFVEGAKGGFKTAVRIIPYLVAMLVGIGVFRASGAMDWLIEGVAWLVRQTGLDSEWVAALPTALMKPLSGSGARGMMVDAMTLTEQIPLWVASELHLPGFYRYDLLHTGSLLRSSRCHPNPSCRYLRFGSRPSRHLCRDRCVLPVLLVKKLTSVIS